MNVIDEKIKVLEDFQKRKDEIILDLVKDIEHIILDMNIEQLEKHGIDGEGIELPEYTDLTKIIKRSKGQITEHVTLKDEGDFHESFFIIYKDKEFTIYSDDIKTNKLINKYGIQIFGLIAKNMEEMIDLIRPELLQKARKIL